MSRAPVTGDSIALPPRRPVALIAILLIVDLGLAAAGAVMLAKGLSSEKPAATPVQKTEVTPVPEAPVPEAPAPEATAAASFVPSPTAIAATTGSAASPAADDTKTAAAPEAKTASVAADKSSASRRAKEKERGPVSGPKDPYADPAPSAAPAPAPAASASASPAPAAQPEPNAAAPTLTTDQEIAKLASTSKAAFDRCTGAAEAHGKIQIAFQVLADGRVANAAAVENSTGNTALAQCLVSTIRGWTLSPHSGSALSFVRPFNYP